MYFGESVFGPRIPKELAISEEVINGPVAPFKSACEEQIKYMKQNGFSDKDISRNVSQIYWGVVGCTFYSKRHKYIPKLSVVIGNISRYCDDKTKSVIKKDMQKTIDALNNIVQKGKELDELQKDYLKDLNANISKL